MITATKRLAGIILLMGIIGNARALDTESYRFIDLLLSLREPAPPQVFDGAVIFTSASTHNRTVGIAFAHEQFGQIHRFKKILVPIDQTEPYKPKSKIEPERLRDSGMLFLAYEPPAGLQTLEYRMITDGLWGPDPVNPARFFDSVTGVSLSVAPLPERAGPPPAQAGEPALHIRCRAEPGDRLSAAGDFNSWDPFMYPLKETRPGEYAFDLPLPPGEYRYTLYRNGVRILDPGNRNKAYTSDGRVVNTLRVE